MSKMLQDDKTEHKTECFSVLIKSLTLKKTQAVAGPYCWQAADSQADLSPGKGNAAHTDQHFLGSQQQYPSTWLGTNKLILFPNNLPESRK